MRRTCSRKRAIASLEPIRRVGAASTGAAGAALSEEALRAYVEARADELIVLRPKMDLDQLAPAIRQRFFFPQPRLEFVACVSPTGRQLLELYVFQGRAQFRGFEATGGLGIWEAVDAETPLFQMLALHHLAEWLSVGRDLGLGLCPQLICRLRWVEFLGPDSSKLLRRQELGTQHHGDQDDDNHAEDDE